MKKFLLGIVMVVLGALSLKTVSFADAGGPDIREYSAYVINPDGITCNDVYVPYLSEILLYPGEIYDYEGEKYCRFYYNNEFSLKTQFSNIALTDANSGFYDDCDKTLYAYRDVCLYAAPDDSLDVKQIVPEGTYLHETHYWGDVYGYVEGDGYSGWLLDVACAYPMPDVMFVTDYYSTVYFSPANILTKDREETGETIPVGETVHVIGEVAVTSECHGEKYFVKLDYKGREVYADGLNLRNIHDMDGTIYITSPNQIKAYTDFGLKETGVDFEYDQVINIKKYLTRKKWFESTFYEVADGVFIEAEFEQGAQSSDCGFFLSDYPQGDKYVLEKDTVAYDDANLTVKRSVIPAGTEVYSIYSLDAIVRDGDEESHIDYVNYIEGYGWMTYNDLLGIEEDLVYVPTEKPVENKEVPPLPVVSRDITGNVAVNTEEQTEQAAKAFNKTFYICLAFAVVIAIAAVFSIVGLVKGKSDNSSESEADNSSESVTDEEKKKLTVWDRKKKLLILIAALILVAAGLWYYFAVMLAGETYEAYSTCDFQPLLTKNGEFSGVYVGIGDKVIVKKRIEMGDGQVKYKVVFDGNEGWLVGEDCLSKTFVGYCAYYCGDSEKILNEDLSERDRYIFFGDEVNVLNKEIVGKASNNAQLVKYKILFKNEIGWLYGDDMLTDYVDIDTDTVEAGGLDVTPGQVYIGYVTSPDNLSPNNIFDYDQQVKLTYRLAENLQSQTVLHFSHDDGADITWCEPDDFVDYGFIILDEEVKGKKLTAVDEWVDCYESFNTEKFRDDIKPSSDFIYLFSYDIVSWETGEIEKWFYIMKKGWCSFDDFALITGISKEELMNW